jgi:drug/metabolite transporter (DMT)-like permease
MGFGEGVARPKVLAALAIVYVVWGSTYLAIKVGLASFPPMLMASVRFLAAGAALYGWVAWRDRRRGAAARPTRRQWLAATIAGIMMLVGGNGAVTWAEQHVDSGIAALLVATVPLWMTVLAWWRHGDRLRRPAVVGLLVGFAGVGLLVRPSGAGTDVLASVVILLGALSWAVGSLYARRAPLPDDGLRSAAMQMLAGGAVFGLLGLAGGEATRLDLAAATPASVLAVAYLSVFGSIVAFSAYGFLLRTAPPASVSTYAYVNPVVAVLLGAVLLAEPVTGAMLGAGAAIVAGVAMIVTTRARPPRTPAVEQPAPPGAAPAQPVPAR